RSRRRARGGRWRRGSPVRDGGAESRKTNRESRVANNEWRITKCESRSAHGYVERAPLVRCSLFARRSSRATGFWRRLLEHAGLLEHADGFVDDARHDGVPRAAEPGAGRPGVPAAAVAPGEVGDVHVVAAAQ